MKKTIYGHLYAVLVAFFSCTILVTVSSCTDDYKFGNELSNKELSVPSIRSIDEALEIAEQAKGMFGNQTSTRSGQVREVDRENVRVICKNKTRANSSNSLDTLIYVVNYADNEGFAIISANLGTEALLGVTEIGNYDDAIAENDGFSFRGYLINI